jgi:carboxyl-terminal processing protease
VYDLSDQSSLHVTVARWLTPDRRQIDGTGLKPDIEVTVSDADKAAATDPVLERAVAQLQGQ